MKSPGAHPVRHAFTMVEVVVVIILITVLGALVLPRMMSNGIREAEQEAKALRMLLTTLAQRDSISGRALAIEFDPVNNRVELMVQRSDAEVDEASGSAGGASTAVAASLLWKPAPLVRPVTLSASELRQVTADARVVGGSDAGLPSSSAGSSAGSWRIEVRQSEPRPAISILIARPERSSDSHAWQIDLLPGQTSASIKGLESPSLWRAPEAESLDLDATGMRAGSW